MTTRRGISSVVGSVFAIIALSTTIGYITYSMTTLDNYNQSVLIRTQQTLDTANEKFMISGATFVNNKLNITVVNTGTLPINFTKLWITNTTAGVDWVKSYIPTSGLVTPGATLKNIGQSAGWLRTDMPYFVKLVTSRGNIQAFNINTGVNTPLFVQTNVLPHAIVPGYQVTVLYAVTNNQTGNNVILSLIPSMSISGSSADAALVSGPSPSSYPSLMPGSSITFKWIYTINGNAGDTITFTPSLLNSPTSAAFDTVTVQNVAFAGQSKSSFSANGLGTAGGSDAMLYLHQEQVSTPTGTYQMYSGQPDSSNLKVINITSTSSSYYTNNDTLPSGSIAMAAGKWNATLRYMSAPMPKTFSAAQYPNLIYHFNTNDNPTKDSRTSPGEDLTVNGAPSWDPSLGVNSSGIWPLNGANQYFSHSVDVSGGGSNLTRTNPSSIAGWFKASSTFAVNQRQDIVRLGDLSGHAWYEVAVLGVSGPKGVLLFQYSFQASASATDAKCQGTTKVDNGKWHHFVATRSATDGNCSLYLDGALEASQATGTSGTSIGVRNNWSIGRNSTGGGGNYFNGYIDDVMIWNNYNFDLAHVTDLLKTSYGTNAQTLNFKISLTDNVGGSPQSVYGPSNYPMQFADSFGDYSANPPASSTHWGQYNFTTGSLSQQVINPQKRLKFDIAYVNPPPANGRIDTVMIIDNTALYGGSPGNSFLQIPFPNSTLPGYYTYDNTADGTVSVYNTGPNKAWVTANSRMVFQNLYGGSDYAGWVGDYAQSGCGGGPCYAIDTTELAAGATTQIKFQKPCTQPGPDSASKGTRAPPGNYRLFAYLNGYDSQGNFLANPQYIGPIKVTGGTGSCPY